MIKTLISVVLLFLSMVVINADGDESKNEEITTASIEGFVEAVKLAIENNHLNLVQILLDGTDGERDKNFALNYAVQKGTKEMVKEILKDPQVDSGFKTDNMTAIQFSVENDLLDMIPLLLPRTNQYYKSKALGVAVKYNKEEIAKEILKDPEVDGEYKACDRNGCETALEWAVSNNNLNLVQLLLSKTKVEYKTRALDKAKKSSKEDIVKEISRDPATVTDIFIRSENCKCNLLDLTPKMTSQLIQELKEDITADDGLIQELKNNITEELEQELKENITEELKQELKENILEELKQELKENKTEELKPDLKLEVSFWAFLYTSPLNLTEMNNNTRAKTLDKIDLN